MIQENVDEILRFWFEQTSSKQKYAKNDAFDALIKATYEDTYWQIVETRARDWKKRPKAVYS